MANEVVLNRAYLAGLHRSPEVLSACREVAREVAQEAERLGRDVSRSYRTEVTTEGEGVRVEANTDPLNAASWIEFGSSNNPPYAPLRRGAEAAGLKSEGVR